jgi:hypothetical protein
LYDVIENPLKNKIDSEVDRIFLKEFQFVFKDVFSKQKCDTVKNIVSTYGFIFGSKAIEDLKREKKTAIRNKFKVYWRE